MQRTRESVGWFVHGHRSRAADRCSFCVYLRCRSYRLSATRFSDLSLPNSYSQSATFRCVSNTSGSGVHREAMQAMHHPSRKCSQWPLYGIDIASPPYAHRTTRCSGRAADRWRSLHYATSIGNACCASLFRLISTYSGFTSIPMNLRPVSRAIFAVVPLPLNGSRTTSPGLLHDRM